VSTPPETPVSKPSPSLWQRLSGPPVREVPSTELKGLGALGVLLGFATGAADWNDARSVLMLSAAWLALSLAMWIRRRV
jgi:hypothetical protein